MINAADKTFVRKEPKGVTLVIGRLHGGVTMLCCVLIQCLMFFIIMVSQRCMELSSTYPKENTSILWYPNEGA